MLSWYGRTWMGTVRQVTNGRLLVTSVTLVGLIVAVLGIARHQYDQASYEADRAVYETERSEYELCLVRVASSAKLSNLANATAQLGTAQDKLSDSLVATFEAIYGLAQDPTSATAIGFRAIVDQLRADVAVVSRASRAVTEAAGEYDRVDPSTCPPEPIPPED
jgi:hypothetical protein